MASNCTSAILASAGARLEPSEIASALSRASAIGCTAPPGSPSRTRIRAIFVNAVHRPSALAISRAVATASTTSFSQHCTSLMSSSRPSIPEFSAMRRTVASAPPVIPRCRLHHGDLLADPVSIRIPPRRRSPLPTPLQSSVALRPDLRSGPAPRLSSKAPMPARVRRPSARLPRARYRSSAPPPIDLQVQADCGRCGRVRTRDRRRSRSLRRAKALPPTCVRQSQPPRLRTRRRRDPPESGRDPPRRSYHGRSQGLQRASGLRPQHRQRRLARGRSRRGMGCAPRTDP